MNGTHEAVTQALATRCDGVITAELARLCRRQSTLSAQAIGVIDAALRRLADDLILAPVRRQPAYAPRVTALFFGGEPNDATSTRG